MKKMFKTLLVSCLVSGSLFAASNISGTVAEVNAKADGTCWVKMKKTDDTFTGNLIIDATGDALKAIVAVALTAQSTGKNVVMRYSSGTWTGIIVQQ